MAPSLRWDVFCRIVDNFGDAGVCWRLARQLAHEHGLAVTLWIDDVASLARFVPELARDGADQAAAGIRVRRLDAAFTVDAPLPDVVIEAFGCGLPDPFADAMARAARPPVWIVLEYLSAEPWIDASHGLPSRHPRLPLTRWFWFPGFTPKTGGVLREQGLFAARDTFREDRGARARQWRALGLANIPSGLRISLFCYANPALPALFDVWAEGEEPVTCVLPEGVARSELDRWTGGAVPHPGQPLTRGRLVLAVAPFVDQDAFDRRLWDCDLNFVRGEDSFVRAQWAGQPFVWHPYPQDEDAHLTKMDAFLTRLESGMPEAVRDAQRAFWYAWNADDPAAAADAWPAYRTTMPDAGAFVRGWARDLARQSDLAGGLVKFCENRL
ncbi:MAG: elongation factor P maturation arginine rhamnosyltransferase EarP [Burkholderiales bacterium]|nr:elongation factor P maturation arginine rhamnosyltransferase EarP [Burkholderiales bacterium]